MTFVLEAASLKLLVDLAEEEEEEEEEKEEEVEKEGGGAEEEEMLDVEVPFCLFSAPVILPPLRF